MKKLTVTAIIFCLSFVLGGFLFIKPVNADWELVRSKDFGTIYYIDSLGIRHPFPNVTTYQSWYGNDFSKVLSVPNDFLFNYPLGKNITIRPGTYLVKVRTAPQVYTVEQGGVLREIQNESIAEEIYGEHWTSRVVDLPDVFFGDYSIGGIINHEYIIPNNILFQDQETKNYYYKSGAALRPFESVEAVLANRFKLENAFVSPLRYTVRDRPIVGFDKNIFNPTAKPVKDSRDCENKNLKAAIIFLADQEYSGEEVGRLQAIKKEIEEKFFWATDGLAEIDVDYPTAILLDDGYLIQKRSDGTTDIKSEVVNTFYDDNPDIFDFVFIWSNFKIPSENTNEIANFVPVTNKQDGLGRNLLSRPENFGSTGKLKGIITMGNINKYHPETAKGLNESLNFVMHEILHQWSAYVSFKDENEVNIKNLLRSSDYSHWSYYAGFISPLGGSCCIDNGDGTFTNGLTRLSGSSLKKYSQLDLYLMGLIPAQVMDPVMYIEPEIPGSIGNILKATPRYVTIDQIIEANGQVRCNTD